MFDFACECVCVCVCNFIFQYFALLLSVFKKQFQKELNKFRSSRVALCRRFFGNVAEVIDSNPSSHISSPFWHTVKRSVVFRKYRLEYSCAGQ